MRLKTTKQHTRWWKNREIDWKKDYLSTWNHPHRDMLSEILKKLNWVSLFEVGCGPGPNLVNIVQNIISKKNLKGFHDRVGGCDINKEAIALAKETLIGGQFSVGPAHDIMMSDNSSDIVLSDMTLIYVGNIDKAIVEMRRVARNYIVLCELHSTSFFARMKLRFSSGYFAYNYKKLLEKHGFYNITLIKIPKEVWDGKPQVPFGYFILARVPKNYD